MSEYLYLIKWEYFDDHEEYVLVHKRKFTDEEWKTIIAEAIVSVLDEAVKEGYYLSTPDVVSRVVEYLKDKYGFVEAEFTNKMWFWGVGLGSLEVLRRRLGDEVMEKIFELVKKVRGK